MSGSLRTAVLTGVAVATTALVGLGAPSVANAAGPAAAVAVAPSISCSFAETTHVSGTDLLRVHTQPSTTSTTIGELPRGAAFHFCSSSGRSAGGHYWFYGRGKNGTTTLTGWVASEYLSLP